MAIKLYNVNVYKIRWTFGRVRLLGARFEQSNLAKISNVSSTFELTKSIKYKSHLYRTKSCKFELLEASVYYNCSISSVSQFITEIEESIVLSIFYPHLEDIQRKIESKRKYTNYRKSRINWIYVKIYNFKVLQYLVNVIQQLTTNF